MTAIIHLKCPICPYIAKSPFSQKEASQTLAQHIMAEHTKRQGPKTVIQVPDPRPQVIRGPGNRAQRRASAKKTKWA